MKYWFVAVANPSKFSKQISSRGDIFIDFHVGAFIRFSDKVLPPILQPGLLYYTEALQCHFLVVNGLKRLSFIWPQAQVRHAKRLFTFKNFVLFALSTLHGDP